MKLLDPPGFTGVRGLVLGKWLAGLVSRVCMAGLSLQGGSNTTWQAKGLWATSNDASS